tara:strand:- start:527 stop:841 length:315 start_codon:yes stop_codon:yes gene_type:complete
MVKRVHKSSDGKYHVAGKSFHHLVGSRAQVHHGKAYKTTGGLKVSDLMMNKHGRIVSRKKAATARRDKRLEKAGYKPTKGKFVIMRKSMHRRKRGRKSRRTKRR